MDNAGGYIDYPFVAEFYDHFTPYRDRKDIGFYLWAAEEYGASILELGCGTGRVMIPLAKAGYEITGLDLSEPMLSVCRQKLSQMPRDVQDRVNLVQKSMRNFELKQKFSLITTPFRCFQHLIKAEDQISCLKCAHNHLKKDGHLILELFNPWIKYLVDDSRLEESGDDPPFVMPDGREVLRRWRTTKSNLFEQYLDIDIIYYVTHPDGRKERLVHSFLIRYLFRYEAEHLLARCGFELEHLYADFDRSSYGSKTPGELIFVARRV